jgi:hypothetical protein
MTVMLIVSYLWEAVLHSQTSNLRATFDRGAIFGNAMANKRALIFICLPRFM